MKIYNVGIIGAGHIALKMASTLAALPRTHRYAIASREMRKARRFAKEQGFERAYGSYEELMDDPKVDLIYIATPHAFHFEQAKASILKGKPVLCEKAFTANAAQAEELLKLAEEKQVFIAEAIWTRYLPMSRTIAELVRNGAVGTPYLLSANLGYAITNRERLVRPELAGGALLDVGVYTLNFAAMVFGTEILSTTSTCVKMDNGLDAQDSITLVYPGERMAVLNSSMLARSDRQGIISGDGGHMIIDNINNPQSIKVLDGNYQTVAGYHAPSQVTGFEYEVNACIEALDKGLLQTLDMPHDETLRIMRQMDALRKEWGVRFPFE
mgnify:FL=1